MKQIPTATSAALVLVPFAIGYFLSYLFRTVNAVIAPSLAAELGFSSTELGLLTSAYFLTFALSQVPLGILLDHFGPRRVQACLFAVAAVGAAVFAAGTNLPVLVAGRALIGLGVSGALMAALKAVVLSFPKERVALVNGCLVMCGGIGAYVAAGPTDALLRWWDWRSVFLLLACVTALSALLIHLAVPDRQRDGGTATLASTLAGLQTVYSDPFFWRVAPASACAIGTAWAIQGLWAARWLAEVDGLPRSEIVFCLSAMAGALAVGALLIGVVGDRLKRAGVNARLPLVVAFTAFALLQTAIIRHLPVPRTVLWCGFAAFGSATVLSYAALAENFPKELAGRANGALNLMHIGLAFVMQWGIGAVVDLWPAQANGHHPAAAYETAFLFALGAQFLAIGWLVAPAAWGGRAVPAADGMISART
jgi:sugar phosphate permease